MKTTSLIVLLFGALLGAVNAEIITVQVTSTVSLFNDYGPSGGYFSGGIVVGDTLVMTYSYDTEAADSSSRSDYGLYYQSVPNALSITAGNYTFQSNIDNLNYYVSIEQNVTGDTYNVRSSNNVISPNTYSGNLGIYWQLNYSSGTFKNTDLPTTAPDISPASVIQVGDDRAFYIVAMPTSVEIIPEPITLLTFGLGSLMAFRNRKISKGE